MHQAVDGLLQGVKVNQPVPPPLLYI